MYLVYTKSNFPCHFVAINTLISLWYISFVYNMFCVLSLSQGWDKAHDIGYALVYSINIILYLSAPGLDGVNRQIWFLWCLIQLTIHRIVLQNLKNIMWTVNKKICRVETRIVLTLMLYNDNEGWPCWTMKTYFKILVNLKMNEECDSVFHTNAH